MRRPLTVQLQRLLCSALQYFFFYLKRPLKNNKKAVKTCLPLHGLDFDKVASSQRNGQDSSHGIDSACRHLWNRTGVARN